MHSVVHTTIIKFVAVFGECTMKNKFLVFLVLEVDQEYLTAEGCKS